MFFFVMRAITNIFITITITIITSHRLEFLTALEDDGIGLN